MPLKWKEKIILAKIETVYGTDAAPTGMANALLMTDASIVPMDGSDVSRNLERPYLGGQEQLPSEVRAVLTGSTELVGSGTLGTAPAWGVLMRACGAAEVISVGTSVVYSPVTQSHESLSIHFYVGSTRHVLRGARGTAVITVNAQGIPVCRWTLTGLWSQPTEETRPTPVFTAWQKPKIATTANTPVFTLGGVALVMRNFSLDLANDVQPRVLVGKEEILIVDRNDLITTTVEAVPLSVYDPYTRALALTPTAVVLTHGTAAATRVKIEAPSCQQMRPTGYENQQNIAEWPLRFSALPTAGNDQWSITLS